MLNIKTTTMGETVHHLASPRPIRARLATTALVGVLAFTAAAVGASSAQAGVWMRTSCMNPDQTPAPSDGWSGGSTGSPSFGSTNNTNCSPNSPMYAALSMQGPAPTGASEYLQYTPPEGSTLVGGSLLVALAAQGYGYRAVATAAMFTPAYQYDSSNVFLQCVAVLAACQNDKPEYYGVVQVPPDRGGNLYLGAGCTGQVAGTACTAGGARGVWSSVVVSWANLLLSSSSLPTATNFAGSLLEPGAHGTSTLTFTAADDGPGIFKAIVTVDGTEVYNATPNTNTGKCVPVGSDPASGAQMWQSQQPCPRSQSVVVPVSTTRLSDGEHEVKVTLRNAAGNVSTVLQQTITTNTRTTVSAKLTSDAPAPPAAPEPQYAIVLDAATQRLTRGVRRGWTRSALTLAGTLRNGAGVPAPGVPVQLRAQDGRQGEAKIIARSSTDAAGHFVLKAPRGPSRTLQITYGSASNDAITITQSVRPAVTLRVRPLGGGRLRFTGRLRISPLGSPRPLIVIQARNGRRWQAVGRNIRVNATGRFSLTYSGGRAVIGGRYSFRAVAPATRYFTTGISPIRKTVAR
jgi:hypothetical protein